MMFSGHFLIGQAVHVINMLAITLALVLSDFSHEKKNMLQSLLLLPQMRIINLAMPQFFTPTLLMYPLLYGVMYISIIYVKGHQNITTKEIGLNLARWYYYIPLGLIMGAGMAMIEFRIVHPVAMIANLKFENILLLSTVMIFFVAAVEELIFRSILQTRLQTVFGTISGILIAGSLFGIMHAGYGDTIEVLFATFFGIVLGFIFDKTKSFPFIVVIHGTANVLLFGVLPIILI
jgi:membrane protease YdiL (CAAX protease family)